MMSKGVRYNGKPERNRANKRTAGKTHVNKGTVVQRVNCQKCRVWHTAYTQDSAHDVAECRRSLNLGSHTPTRWILWL